MILIRLIRLAGFLLGTMETMGTMGTKVRDKFLIHNY